MCDGYIDSVVIRSTAADVRDVAQKRFVGPGIRDGIRPPHPDCRAGSGAGS